MRGNEVYEWRGMRRGERRDEEWGPSRDTVLSGTGSAVKDCTALESTVLHCAALHYELR